jgi:multidrug resistance protein, MATE family
MSDQTPANPPAVSAHPLRELLAVAAPTVGTMTSYTLMQFTDKLMVSKIGPEPIYVGAQGNGGLAAWVPISIAMGATTVVNTYVAQNMGAGRPERGPAYVWNSMWMNLVYWLVLMVPLGFAMPWVMQMTPPDVTHPELRAEQLRMSIQYGQVLVFGSILTMWTRAVSQYFYGMHHPGIVLVAGLTANIVNVGVNYVLIFGKLGFPALGVFGSAIGTLISTAVELAIPLAVFLGPRLHGLYATRSAWRWSTPHVKEILKLGWPSGLMFGNEMVCWGYFMVYLVSGFGALHATAGWIAHQYMSLSFMPAVGISVACTAVVGKYMGMRRPDLAAKRAWLALGLAMAYMLACAVVFVVFRKELVLLFVKEDTPPGDLSEIVRLGSMFLIAAATFQAFDALAMTTSGALRGAGDTVVPGVLTMVLAWGVIVGGGTAMVRFWPGLESLGPWIAASTYIAVLGTLLMGRFMRGTWKRRQLLKDDPPIAQT